MNDCFYYRKRSLVVVCALLAMLLMTNCGDDETTFDPIPSSPIGGVLTGTVHDGDAGVANATVRLEPVIDGVALSVAAMIENIAKDELGKSGADPATTFPALSGIRVTISDTEGRYAFDRLEEGIYLLESNAKDHLAGSGYAEISKTAAATADTTLVDIALLPTGTFTGNATLQNATDHSSTVVYVTGSSNVAVTDAAGDYELRGVPIGDHTIQATHTGWLDRNTAGTLSFAGDSTGLASMELPRESNMAPVVEILPFPALPSPNIYEPIQFNAAGDDPDGSIVLVEWDFEDDGTFDYADPSAWAASFAAPDTGSYRAKVRVTDDDGAIGLAVLEYHVRGGIYVWGEEGDDSSPGTPSQPVKTIQHGIDIAEPIGVPVIVHKGSYWEDIQFKSNVSVWGGYDRETGWTRDPGSYSQVWLQSYYEHVAVADNVTNATIRGLEIEAETAQGSGSSSIALKLISCDSTLIFQDCRIIAGNATAALSTPPEGENGIAGDTGGEGQDACDPNESGCLWYCVGGYGGAGAAPGYNGGDGGFFDTFEQLILLDGETGAGPYGGTGGASVTNCSYDADDGGLGGNGSNGSDGSTDTPIGASYGTIAGTAWTGESGSSGTGGTAGQGGSGGGGGGALFNYSVCYINGAGGGGGGGAGGGGAGGAGGYPGGASIAVLSISSNSFIDSCYVQAGNGGNGWRGSDGGTGGSGGTGGAGGAGLIDGSGSAGAGGNGGHGGSGGHGGGGQGGPGGPSVGVYIYGGIAPVLINNTWSTGSGGTGGPGGWDGGGTVQAPSGPIGPSSNIFVHP